MFNIKLVSTRVGPFSIEFTANYDLFSLQQYHYFLQGWWARPASIQATGRSKIKDGVRTGV